MAPHIWEAAGIGPYRGFPTDDQALAFLLCSGSSLPGSLIVGDDAWTEAQATLRDAGQPLTAWVAGAWEKGVTHSAAGEAIVKVGRTQVDASLLRCEWHAAKVLAAAGFDVAQMDVRDAGTTVELHVRRHDRLPSGFRRPLYSLACLDAEFVGLGTGPWPEAVKALIEGGVVSSSALVTVEAAWNFGRMIGNADMHMGNLAFTENGKRHLELAPLYDMLPMALRGDPAAGSGWVLREIRALLPALGESHPSARAALAFWSRVAGDGHMIPAVRDVARQAMAEFTRAAV